MPVDAVILKPLPFRDAGRLITVYNLPILVAAMALLVVCALLAGLLPARRAAAIDPIEARRAE